MTPDLTSPIAVRKARWREFYDLNSPRRFLLMVQYFQDDLELPKPTPENKVERIEWSWQMYLRQLERSTWLEDDAIPHLYPHTGTEIFAQAFGCNVLYPADNLPFALPLINSASQVAALKVPSIDTFPLGMLFEIADELRRRAGREAVMRLVDVQCPMDVAALIWRKDTFFAAMHDAPEAVLELSAKVRQLQIAFLDEWFRCYGTDFTAHYPDYYMPTGITLSEDEAGAVSPAMFERFFLPELVELAQHFGGMGMHCCAHARHQWQGFLKIPNLHMLNFVQPHAVLLEAQAFYAGRIPQMHNWDQGWEMQALQNGREGFPTDCRSVLRPLAESPQQARSLVDQFHQNFAV
jgi:hypothetical protein